MENYPITPVENASLPKGTILKPSINIDKDKILVGADFL